jgi:hypothetical protein
MLQQAMPESPFEQTVQDQYTRELTPTCLVDLMPDVACGIQPPALRTFNARAPSLAALRNRPVSPGSGKIVSCHLRYPPLPSGFGETYSSCSEIAMGEFLPNSFWPQGFLAYLQGQLCMIAVFCCANGSWALRLRHSLGNCPQAGRRPGFPSEYSVLLCNAAAQFTLFYLCKDEDETRNF